MKAIALQLIGAFAWSWHRLPQRKRGFWVRLRWALRFTYNDLRFCRPNKFITWADVRDQIREMRNEARGAA